MTDGVSGWTPLTSALIGAIVSPLIVFGVVGLWNVWLARKSGLNSAKACKPPGRTGMFDPPLLDVEDYTVTTTEQYHGGKRVGLDYHADAPPPRDNDDEE